MELQRLNGGINELQKTTYKKNSYRLGLNKFRLEETEKCSQPSGE